MQFLDETRGGAVIRLAANASTHVQVSGIPAQAYKRLPSCGLPHPG